MTIVKKQNKNAIISTFVYIDLDSNLDYMQIGNFKICSAGYINNFYPCRLKYDKDEFSRSFLVYETYKKINKGLVEVEFPSKLEDFMKILIYFKATRVRTFPEFDFIDIDEIKRPDCIYETGMDICFSNRSTCSASENEHFLITNEIFNTIGNNREIGNYVESVPTTEIERKIYMAVGWIGNSLNNRNLTEGYVGLCIALETLLSGESSLFERGTAYQLREYGAFLCSENKKERIQFCKKIKELYAIRCAISHQGISSKLSEEKFYDLLEILKKIIHQMYILLKAKEIDNFSKLTKYIEELKFL